MHARRAIRGYSLGLQWTGNPSSRTDVDVDVDVDINADTDTNTRLGIHLASPAKNQAVKINASLDHLLRKHLSMLPKLQMVAGLLSLLHTSFARPSMISFWRIAVSHKSSDAEQAIFLAVYSADCYKRTTFDLPHCLWRLMSKS